MYVNQKIFFEDVEKKMKNTFIVFKGQCHLLVKHSFQN